MTGATGIQISGLGVGMSKSDWKWTPTLFVDALAVYQRHQVHQTEHEIRHDEADAQSVNYPPASE